MATRSQPTTPELLPFVPNPPPSSFGVGWEPGSEQSMARVVGDMSGRTSLPAPTPSNQPSSATVQYGGPQVTNSRQTNPGMAGALQMALGSLLGGPLGALGVAKKGAVQRPTKSAAKVSDTSGGSGGGAIGSVADPSLAAPDQNALAMQMFFTQTIAPYLDQIRASMGENAKLTENAYADILPNVNKSLQPYFNPQRQGAQVRTLADALAASTAAAPSLDQLMGQIAAAQEAQKYAAYQAMKAQSGQAAGGLIGQLLGAGAEDDGLAALLGEGLASEAKKKK